MPYTTRQSRGDLAALKEKAISPYFLDLLERAEALQERGDGIKVWKYRLKKGEDDAEVDQPFKEWIAEAALRCKNNESPRRVLLVSGELYTDHWNALNEKVEALGQTVMDFFFTHCQVHGVCCSYINVPSSENAPEPHAVNALYQQFKQAAAEGRPNIRLYSSYTREECHWICVGDEMRVADWHLPCKGDTNKRENTFIIRGPAVAKFAREEFAYTLRRLKALWSLFVPPAEYRKWWNAKEPARGDGYPRNSADQAAQEEYASLYGIEEEAVPYLRHGAASLFQCLTTEEINKKLEEEDERVYSHYAEYVKQTLEEAGQPLCRIGS